MGLGEVASGFCSHVPSALWVRLGERELVEETDFLRNLSTSL